MLMTRLTVLYLFALQLLLAPFRRLLPNMGMIDLSPILAFLALYVAEILMNEAAKVLLTGL